MDAHERYEELAVGHVLGGLTASDAAAFRSHLLGCRDCRLRVAELRGIAADLAAAEREERAEARVRTEVAQRTDLEDQPAPAGPGVPSRMLGLGIALAVVLFGALSFWNLHLRTQVAATTLLTERQQTALAELATGVSVSVDTVAPASGLVVVDGDEVAFSFVSLPPLVGTERYVVWLVGGGDQDDSVVLIARSDDRRVAGAVEQDGAAELIVTVEDGPRQPVAPAGRQVATAHLSAGQAPGS
ncbi:MAG: anti-sigma factor [Nitriliruptor sp.]|uniref:anti-sigma factor domain-containing protein n=1 Tax=Nitriliruptor sp. TaxID=2448056 RepID=UPI0034A00700